VRELENVIERAVIVARSGALDFNLPDSGESRKPTGFGSSSFQSRQLRRPSPEGAGKPDCGAQGNQLADLGTGRCGQPPRSEIHDSSKLKAMQIHRSLDERPN
jgi:DNA-binding NtrC family response regulator